ncbi:MAG TPA: tRNA uridine-5-carboxymethylaminomethyl(34) synthesis GTPase MnmE [Bacilli bacterium]
MINDTIGAISTPAGEGGIAVIRVSGPDSVAIVDRVFATKNGLANAPTHTVHYGFVKNPETGEKIEEALVTVMRAPRSFTKEDVVEVSCHGGYIAVKKVLELLLEMGIRLAEPGEFTKRAFINGRIDLSQAEAVIDLIRAKSDRAFALAMKQAQGKLSEQIRGIRQTLLELMAHIEVNIDYPEHDVAEMTNNLVTERCKEALDAIDRLLATAGQGKILREGIVTAIIGRPNVGKSSLLNLLTRENRAIVTDIPGTTRDVIEEYVTVAGIPLRLLDTAGIRETNDVVEKIGVERSKSALADADLILFVISQNEPLAQDERALLDEVKDRQTICVVNKTDLPRKLDLAEIYARFSGERVVPLSAVTQEGLGDLENAISRLFFSGKLEANDLTYVSNVRHIQLLKNAKQALLDASLAVERLIPIDMIQIDIRKAWEELGEIIGEEVGESLLDQIFSQFCLGK